MPERAAIVTGGARGIGRAIAVALGESGYGLTLTARRPDALEQTADELRGRGFEVEHVAANLADPDAVRAVVSHHRERFGRLDALVNNAGMGVGAPVQEQQLKYVDMQLNVNLRAIILLYTECAEMLKTAGAEHGNALVVNLSSDAGRVGDAWLSVYSATKAGVIRYTESMNKELNSYGVKSVALCPGWVDTDMSEWAKDTVDRAAMLRPEDLAEAVRFLLRVSRACVVSEIVLGPLGGNEL